MTWTDLNLLHESPVLEDQIVCAIADSSVDEVYDVSLIEIINNKFDWITPEQVQKFVRNAAKSAIKALDSHRAKNAGEVEQRIREHISWLHGYFGGMTKHNWADMQLYGERQLPQLSEDVSKLISTLRSAIAEKDDAIKRLVSRSSEEEDFVGCESCDDRKVPREDAVYSEGCYFCPKCWGEIQTEIAACEHDLIPTQDEMGDDCQYCSKCSGLFYSDDRETRARSRISDGAK